MIRYALTARSNQSFKWTRDFSTIAGVYDLSTAVIRMQIRTVGANGLVYEFSTANNRISYNATSHLVTFSAPVDDMLGLVGYYKLDCRLELANGARVVVFSANIEFKIGRTLTAADATWSVVGTLGDTVEVAGEDDPAPVPFPLELTAAVTTATAAATAAAASAAAAADSAAQAVGLPPGGTTGQFLKKASSANYAATWATLATVAISGAYTDLSGLPDISGQITAAINALLNNAPAALDTLGEIATQLAADESAAAALTTTVAGKLAKTSNLSDLASASSARTNLGLAAIAASGSATDLTTGTLPNARLSSIPNSALANSSVTISGHPVSLGGSLSLASGDVSGLGALATLTPGLGVATALAATAGGAGGFALYSTLGSFAFISSLAYSSLTGLPSFGAAASLGVGAGLSSSGGNISLGDAYYSYSNGRFTLPTTGYVAVSAFSANFGTFQIFNSGASYYGTNGTLTGVTANTTSGTKSIVLSAGHGISNGQYVSIGSMPGYFILSGVGATSATLNRNATSTLTGATVQYGYLPDPQMSFGYNLNKVSKSTEPEFIFNIESNFLDADGYVKMEAYTQFTSVAGNAIRPFFVQIDKTQSLISQVFINGGYGGFSVFGGVGDGASDGGLLRVTGSAGTPYLVVGNWAAIYSAVSLRNITVVNSYTTTIAATTVAGTVLNMAAIDNAGTPYGQIYAYRYDTSAAIPILMNQFGGSVNIGLGAPGSTADLSLKSSYTLGWDNGSGTADTIIRRDAANVFAHRNSTNAQTVRVYNTYTDASNYERGVFDWQTTANVLRIGTEAAGTGTVRNISLVGGNVGIGITAPGTPLQIVNTSGNSLFAVRHGTSGVVGMSFRANWPTLGFNTWNPSGTDNYMGTGYAAQISYDAASGNLYFVNFPSGTSDTALGSSTTRLVLNASGLLQFAGTSSSFPAIKRNGAAINFRLADDSADAAITAASISTSSTTLHSTSVALTNGAGASAGTLTNAPAAGNPTKWIPINDNGTTRYIPAW